MTINGKADGFTREDFRACESVASLKRGRGDRILDEVRDAVRRWPAFSERARVAPGDVKRIADTHRLRFPS